MLSQKTCYNNKADSLEIHYTVLSAKTYVDIIQLYTDMFGGKKDKKFIW